MLVQKEDEDLLNQILEAIGGAIAVSLIGRAIGAYLNARAYGTQARTITLLEQAYLAGKAAQALGNRQLKKMPTEELKTWLENNRPTLDDAEPDSTNNGTTPNAGCKAASTNGRPEPDKPSAPRTETGPAPSPTDRSTTAKSEAKPAQKR
jgi:hypothetical protein